MKVMKNEIFETFKKYQRSEDKYDEALRVCC